MSASLLRMYPQAVPGRPQTVRWVLPDADLRPGRVPSASGDLGALLRDGLITDLLVEAHGVWTTLRDGESWREHADRVRSALMEALAGELPIEPDGDVVLAAVVADVLAGPTGHYVRSHGGSVQVLGVQEGVVDLEFLGACSNCSAAGATLHERIETAVRKRFPTLVKLHDVDEGKKRTGHFTLWPSVRPH